MTTVVFTEKQVAGDGRMIDGYGGLLGCNLVKVFQNHRYIVGFAGAVGQCQRVKDWVLNDFKSDEGEECIPYISEQEVISYDVCFIDKLDGRLYGIEGVAFDIIELEYPHAIGSGAAYAMGYMSGKHKSCKGLAAKAVNAASKFDAGTNSNIVAVDVILDACEDFDTEE